MQAIRLPRVAASLVVAVMLSACGGGGTDPAPDRTGDDPKQGRCTGNFLGASRVSTSTTDCPLCRVSEPEKSIDGDRDTFASISFDPGGGTASLRATAQDGIVFAAGNQAGALLAIPTSASAVSRYRFRTYLDNVFQEEGGGSDDLGGDSVGAGKNYHGFPTRKPFDAVEIVITRSGSADAGAFRIHEVCAE